MKTCRDFDYFDPLIFAKAMDRIKTQANIIYLLKCTTIETISELLMALMNHAITSKREVKLLLQAKPETLYHIKQSLMSMGFNYQTYQIIVRQERKHLFQKLTSKASFFSPLFAIVLCGFLCNHKRKFDKQ